VSPCRGKPKIEKPGRFDFEKQKSGESEKAAADAAILKKRKSSESEKAAEAAEF